MAGGKHAVERRCLVTGTVLPTDQLMRFVVGPGDEVVFDLKRNLPGRGVWVYATRASVEEAAVRKRFAKGFRAAVKTPSDLATQVENGLERSCLGALSMARKAGDLVIGFGKVEAALTGGRAVAILHANEAADDGVRKLAAAERRGNRSGSPVPVLRMLSSAQMNLALGETNVIHAALLDGPAGRNALERAGVLIRYRENGSHPVIPNTEG